MNFFSEKAKSSTHRGAKSRSKGSSKSKSSSKSREQSEGRWGDWEWDPARQQFSRCRETRSGEWEYEYDYLNDSTTPRTAIKSDVLIEEDETNQYGVPHSTYETNPRQEQTLASSGNVPSNTDFQSGLAAELFRQLPATTLGSSSFSSSAQPEQGSFSYEFRASDLSTRQQLSSSFYESSNGPSTQRQQSYVSDENSFQNNFSIPQPSTTPFSFIPSSASGFPQQAVNFAPSARSQQVVKSRERSYPAATSYPTERSYSAERGYPTERNYPAERNYTAERSTSSFGVTTPGGLFSWVQGDPGHISITKPENWFKPGRIFRTTWAEPGKPSNEVRTFVVMREGRDSSVCCLLQPYSTNGFKNGNSGQNYAVIFSAGSPPQLCQGEEPPEMVQFRVIIEKPCLTIDPTLRLDFSRVYTIEHNTKVRNVGRIDRDFLKELKTAFLTAMGAKPSETDIRQTGFGNNSGRGDEVRISTEYNYGSPMVDGRTSPIPSLGEEDFHVVASQTEPLHRDFQVHPAKDFEFGKIFKILWTEPKGQRGPKGERDEDGYGTDYVTMPTKYGEDVYTTIRRFVIVKGTEGHCLCLPILTYRGQGTKKYGVKPQDHAIIYTAKSGQKPREASGEEKLQNKAIRMEPRSARDQLDSLSRLNYAKIYTVEYNVKVCFIGQIHEKSMKYFVRDFNRQHLPLPEADDLEFSDKSGSDRLL